MNAVLFDVDGVLIDSSEANLRFYQNLLFQIGQKRIAESKIRPFLSHTMADMIKYFYPDLSQERIQTACSLTIKTYPSFRCFIKLEKNVKPVLRQLKKKYQLGVVTNRINTKILDYFKISGFFQVFITCQDCQQPKPHPEPLLLAVKKLKTKPQKAVYIGDSKLDEIAAQRAKINFIAYKNNSLKTHYHLTDFNQLPKILENIF